MSDPTPTVGLFDPEVTEVPCDQCGASTGEPCLPDCPTRNF